MSIYGNDFMRGTYYRHLLDSDQMRGIRRPPLELPYERSAGVTSLPAPDTFDIPPRDLRKAIEERESVRRYTEEELGREEFAFLLWCTQGVKRVSGSTFRTVPSAGARHAFETFLLINRVTGLPPGLYRYLALTHELLSVAAEGDVKARLQAACFDQPMVSRCAATFLWVAVPYRMTWRYGERGYRYLHLDAGHVCQNLYLSAEAAACGVCAIAAFDDEKVNEILGIDGEEAFAIYLATVGRR